MNSLAFLKKFKTAYTPMEASASILPLYMRRFKETGPFEDKAILIVPNSTDDPYLEKHFTENKNRSYIKLNIEFCQKWNVFESHFKNFSKDFVFEKIKEVINSFLSLNPDYITFDLTEDCSVFFQASVNGFNVYYELFFVGDLREQVEAVINVYNEGNCIFAFGGSIYEAFQKLKLRVVKQNNIEPTCSAYVLSEPTLTPTGL
jgi:hypothetical protein